MSGPQLCKVSTVCGRCGCQSATNSSKQPLNSILTPLLGSNQRSGQHSFCERSVLLPTALKALSEVGLLQRTRSANIYFEQGDTSTRRRSKYDRVFEIGQFDEVVESWLAACALKQEEYDRCPPAQVDPRLDCVANFETLAGCACGGRTIFAIDGTTVVNPPDSSTGRTTCGTCRYCARG